MNPMVSDTVDLQSPDDIALADRMNAGRQQIVTELKKIIVGQDEVIKVDTRSGEYVSRVK